MIHFSNWNKQEKPITFAAGSKVKNLSQHLSAAVALHQVDSWRYSNDECGGIKIVNIKNIYVSSCYADIKIPDHD